MQVNILNIHRASFLLGFANVKFANVKFANVKFANVKFAKIGGSNFEAIQKV